MRITYDEGVFEELVNLSVYLAEDDEEIAQKFLDACDVTFRFLAANPLLGSPQEFRDPRLADVRIWKVKHFEKYLVLYAPLEDGIRILHLIHSARDYRQLFDDRDG